MNTTEKGNKLENEFYDFLQDQLDRDQLVFDVYPASLCQLHKKKKYYCKERQADIEFDVVIEVRRKGHSEPHIFVIFECKNHENPIQERDITDFSDKIGRIFGHGGKGLVVSSSRLQSGAERIARSRRLGIVKFDKSGIDVVADRKGRTWTEGSFLQTQIFDGSKRPKSLKFSAYSDGRYFGSVAQMLQSFEQNSTEEGDSVFAQQANPVAFVSEKEVREIAQDSLNVLGHVRGAVDVKKLCALLDLDLSFSERAIYDSEGNQILGSANFEKRSIEINLHGNDYRERFTIAHEIGHFRLGHANYLYSDSIIEHDLLLDAQSESAFNFDRLEYQANFLASELLLPYDDFLTSVEALRLKFGIYDRGFGYIFVDDQKCNYAPYNQLMLLLSNHYEVSSQAIEIRLKRMGLLTDRREKNRLRRMGSLDWHLGR